MRVGFFYGLDKLVLTGGKVHGLEVKAFGLVLVIAADYDDGDVGFGGDINSLLEIGCAGFGSVVCGIFAFHADTNH